MFGGSPFRPEATGYGLVYITKLAVKDKANRSMKGLRCMVSGSGNVAQYASQKLLELGAKVLSVSDSNGVLLFDDDDDDGGMTKDDLQAILEWKNVKRGRLSELNGKLASAHRYVPGQSVWEQDNVPCDIALPCATQNEIDEAGAKQLLKNGCWLVAEGANLPTTLKGQHVFRSSEQNPIYIPAKAANAGGVGVSGLEMSQNAQKITWKPKEVDDRLQSMMADIYHQCQSSEGSSLEEGANRAGFRKVAAAMKELGWLQ